MTVDWSGYEPYVPLLARPLHELSRGEARAEFERLMFAKGERIEELRRLLEQNGVLLRGDDAGLEQLDVWACAEVEASPENSSRLRNVWYAVVNDLALFLGDVIIERSPVLRWELFTAGAKNISYHRHVIMGFTRVPNSRYDFDIDRLVATHLVRVVGGLPEDTDYFVKIVQHTQTIA